MKKIYNLEAWQFDSKITMAKQAVSASIRFKYIDLKKVITLVPKERIASIDRYYRDGFSRLLEAGLFSSYTLVGSKRRPTGVEVVMSAGKLEKIARFRFVESVFIHPPKGEEKVRKEDINQFFCIKMTVAIQVEGMRDGFQSYDERFVLIKAKSFDDAYKKIERQLKKHEAKPYLNTYGNLVRWKVERLDDCYKTDILTVSDLDKPEGVEVYSVLKKRKLTKERYWDGKSE